LDALDMELTDRPRSDSQSTAGEVISRRVRGSAPKLLPRLLKNYAFAMRSFYFKRERIEEMQAKKLSRLLRFSYDYVPYYRRLFRTLGKVPEDFRGVKSLRQFPLLSKAEIVGNYPSGLVAGGQRRVVVRRGTGTTGVSAAVAHSSASLDVRHALFLRYLTFGGMRPWSRLVTLWIPQPYWRREPDREGRLRPTTSLYGYPVWFLGRPLTNIRVVRSIPDDIMKEARIVREIEPDFLFGRPTQLRRLGEAMQKQGISFSPKGVMASAEFMTPTCIAGLEKTYSSKVFSAMGTSETGGVSSTCPRRSGFHLYEDFMVLEILRDGEPVGPGEVGEIVVTHLHNYAMPLIRYRTGDYVRLGDGSSCECGSSLSRFKSVQGREKNWLITAKGERAWPIEFADRVESELGIKDFQVIQMGLGQFVVKLMGEDMGKADVRKWLADFIESVVGCQVSVSFEQRPKEDIWKKYAPVVTQVS